MPETTMMTMMTVAGIPRAIATTTMTMMTATFAGTVITTKGPYQSAASVGSKRATEFGAASDGSVFGAITITPIVCPSSA